MNGRFIYICQALALHSSKRRVNVIWQLSLLTLLGFSLSTWYCKVLTKFAKLLPNCSEIVGLVVTMKEAAPFVNVHLLRCNVDTYLRCKLCFCI